MTEVVSLDLLGSHFSGYDLWTQRWREPREHKTKARHFDRARALKKRAWDSHRILLRAWESEKDTFERETAKQKNGAIKMSGDSEAEFQEQLTILECLDDD